MASKQLASLMVAGTFKVAQELCMSIWNILTLKLVKLMLSVHQAWHLNTFTAIVDLSRFNNSCIKSPASTFVDLIFQSRFFSLNQLTWRETCTAASVNLADVIFIPLIVYYAYIAITEPVFILMLRGRVGCLWLQSIKNQPSVPTVMSDYKNMCSHCSQHIVFFRMKSLFIMNKKCI
jgi:hypothetical protein